MIFSLKTALYTVLQKSWESNYNFDFARVFRNTKIRFIHSSFKITYQMACNMPKCFILIKTDAKVLTPLYLESDRVRLRIKTFFIIAVSLNFACEVDLIASLACYIFSAFRLKSVHMHNMS